MADTRHAQPRPLAFRPRHRLSLARDFDAAYRRGVRRSAGPITIYALPNGRSEHRLGLSVGRRIGNAVARNRLKRLVREAFRHIRPALPVNAEGAFDLVVVARPHRPLPLPEYERILADLATRAHRELAAGGDGIPHGPA